VAADPSVTDATDAVLQLHRSGGVARLVLDRPDQLNTINLHMAQSLRDAGRALSADKDVRVVVLEGAGRNFCGGGDLREFGAVGAELPEHLRQVTEALHEACELLTALPAPLVAAVRGAAAGAGLGLACLADLVIASDTARFAFAYSAIGFTPDGGTSWTLPRIIGERAALDLALTNRRLDATEALSLGLVSRVIPDDDLDAEVTTLAEQLAGAATGAIATTRRMMREGATTGFAEQLARESTELSRASGTDDGREGLAAFLEKRPPKFTGRTDRRRL